MASIQAVQETLIFAHCSPVASPGVFVTPSVPSGPLCEPSENHGRCPVSQRSGDSRSRVEGHTASEPGHVSTDGTSVP